MSCALVPNDPLVAAARAFRSRLIAAERIATDARAAADHAAQLATDAKAAADGRGR